MYFWEGILFARLLERQAKFIFIFNNTKESVDV